MTISKNVLKRLTEKPCFERSMLFEDESTVFDTGCLFENRFDIYFLVTGNGDGEDGFVLSDNGATRKQLDRIYDPSSEEVKSRIEAAIKYYDISTANKQLSETIDGSTSSTARSIFRLLDVINYFGGLRPFFAE
jgi:hypothetical protein